MDMLMKMLTERRTYRRFDQSRPIPEAALADILEAARLASSARNGQTTRLKVVQEPELVEAVFENTSWAASLPRELGRPREGEKPVMFVIIANGGKETAWTGIDQGLVISNMTLAAWNHGIGSCILGSIKKKAVADLLGIPEEMGISCAVAFGYPTHKAEIVPAEKDGSLSYYLDENHDYMVPKLSVEELQM